MEIVATRRTTVKQQLADIALDISWAKISQRYFGKSSSWIYHKLDGRDGNGGVTDFTIPERAQLRNALFDFSDRIRRSAEKIEI
ncbi:hypothetical protein AGMMS50262_04660 [Bacteroidia bacterium]|nr:hypothetical protein AGMMS50262_04660 [Bacteroidia bacterium]